MTASAKRRSELTRFGALLALLGAVALIAVSAVAVTTLRNSNEGRAPETDDRQVIAYPSTPNAVIGVVDDFDRLTSLAVLTLSPEGAGGSIVSVPVNADSTNGFGPERLPISRQPFSPGDADHEAQLVSELEPLLTLTIQRAVVVGPDELAALIEPFAPLVVDLPEDVVDSDTAGSGIVAEAGEQALDVDEIVDVFTAISVDGESYDHHDVDMAMWSAIAERSVDASGVDLPRDENDRPVDPGSFDEMFGRLFAGDVAARDLAINRDGALTADNDDDADFVLVDRRDSLLVFGAISPGLVTRPNEAPSFKLVVAFTEGQVEALGVDADGEQITKASMTRRFIGELVFGQANIVAVDLREAPEVVPERTILEVSDERLVDSVRAVSDRFFGEADVVIADTLTEGTDVVVTLGDDFLEQRAELLDIERAAAEEAADADDGVADFDVSGQDDGEAADDAGDTVPVDE